jgi:hypothetical protein
MDVLIWPKRRLQAILKAIKAEVVFTAWAQLAKPEVIVAHVPISGLNDVHAAVEAFSYTDRLLGENVGGNVLPIDGRCESQVHRCKEVVEQ